MSTVTEIREAISHLSKQDRYLLMAQMRPYGEVKWLLEWITKTIKSAPTMQWRWAPYSSSWDPAYIREVFRKDATEDSVVIWQA